jgi:hypothetical protein
VILPANGPGYPVHLYNTYNIYGTVFLHGSQSVLSGYGALLNCVERGACIQVGDLLNSNDAPNNTIQGLSFTNLNTSYSSIPAYHGVAIMKTVISSGIATITTATAHGFRIGDMVTQLFTDNSCYWGDAVIAAVPTSTTYQYPHPNCGGSVASQATPGVVALAYVAVLDNGFNTHFVDISYSSYGNYGLFNNFFDMWDDENASIDHFNNAPYSLNHGLNWTGSFIFSGGAYNIPTRGQQLAPVITVRDSTITANTSNCVTDYNSNGLYLENTTCQASGLWEVYSADYTGNYKGAYLKNIYSESTVAMNPAQNPVTPYPGLGIAGLISGASSEPPEIQGRGGVQGAFPTGGTGSIPYTYYIIVNDCPVALVSGRCPSGGTQSSPMQILNWGSTGSDSIPVKWPRVANAADTITYDVIRMTTPLGIGQNAPYPYIGGCMGGKGGSCGSVVTGLSQSAACSGGLVCTYTDRGSSTTAPYAIKLGTYRGLLSFWPGAIVTIGGGIRVAQEQFPVVGIGLNGNPLQVADVCSNYGVTSPGGYTTCLASITAAPGSGVQNQSATVLTDGGAVGGGQTVTKGRLNFSSTSSTIVQPHHIITLIDSQPSLTQSTWGYRPPAGANDTWIGTDVPSSGAGLSSGQLAFGAPVSITDYIRATGDGVHANWLEQLTSKQKTFAVPVRISEGNSFTLGDGSPLSKMKVYSVDNMPASHVHPQSCIDVVGEARGLTKSDQIASITPPGRLGNLSLNAYPADEGAIVLHFCNPSTSEVVTPLGTYSFLAVR